MVEAVTEFFTRLAEGFATPAGLILATLAALALLVLASRALTAALRVEPTVKTAAPKRAAPRSKPAASALPRAA